MSGLATGDLHINDNGRDAYRLKFLDRLPKLAADYQANTIIILGDMTEAKDRHSAWLVNRIVSAIAHMTACGFNVIFVQGNHDYAEIGSPFFEFISHIPKVRFISKPVRSGGTMFLPHTRNYERDWQGLNFEGVKLIYTHNTFDGARGDNGQELRGIPLNALPGVPMFSGDVHVPQSLGNMAYVGAPYTINFGDNFKPRMFRIQQNGSGIPTTIQSITIKGPGKRLIQLDHVGRSSDLDFIGQLDMQLDEVVKGDAIRVEVTLRQSEYPRWAEMKEKIRTRLDRQLEVGAWLDGIIPIVDVEQVRATIQRRHREPISDDKLLANYCKQRNVAAPMAKAGQDML